MEEYVFHPPRRRGLVVNGAVILLVAAGGALGLLRASVAETDLNFLLFMLPAVLAVLVAPPLLYRSLALQRASYTLMQDGIRLRWGLRSEQIPMPAVTWVGLASQHIPSLPLPRLYWPGALLGARSLPGGKTLELLAAQTQSLVIISTVERIFAISPANPAEFLRVFQSLSEYGSFTPIQPHSVYPTFLLSRSWADRPARLLILIDLILLVGLLVWVVLAIPAHPQVSLRLTATGAPVEYVPGVRLMLLPVLNILFFIIDLLLGLFFYRRAETQPLSYLMWSSSAFASLLFLGAVMFILRVA